MIRLFYYTLISFPPLHVCLIDAIIFVCLCEIFTIQLLFQPITSSYSKPAVYLAPRLLCSQMGAYAHSQFAVWIQEFKLMRLTGKLGEKTRKFE